MLAKNAVIAFMYNGSVMASCCPQVHPPLCSTKKYDANIANGALYRAKEEFLKRFADAVKEEPKLVPLKEFRDPRYAADLAFSPA